jgi:uncharacterized GH25 family protein
MRPCTANLFAAFLLVTLNWLPRISLAHDFWIDPDRFDLQAGDAVALTLRQGVRMKGNSLPYLTPLIADFSTTDGTGRKVIQSMMGNDPAAVLVVESGTTLVGYQSNRDYVEMEPPKFQQYLDDEGLDYIAEERRTRGEQNDPAREYFIRCSKLLLQATPAKSDELFSTRLGYTLELLPETDPSVLSAGEELSLQLLYLGQPIAGVLVRAVSKDEPDGPVDRRTDADGRVTLVLNRPGTWLIKAVHMIRLENDNKAQWESYWASLLFHLN